MEEMLKMIEKRESSSYWDADLNGYSLNKWELFTLIDIEMNNSHNLGKITHGLITEICDDEYFDIPDKNFSSFEFKYMKSPNYAVKVENYMLDVPIMICVKKPQSSLIIYYPVVKYCNCVFKGKLSKLNAWKENFLFENCVWKES